MITISNIYKFTDLFVVNSSNVCDYLENNKKKTSTELIKSKNKKILDKFGVYFLLENKINQKNNKKYLNN